MHAYTKLAINDLCE